MKFGKQGASRMSLNSFKNNDLTLSENLVSLRRSHGMTQQNVADYLNINRTTYTKYETGVTEPGIETLLLIAKLYGVTLDELTKAQIKAELSEEPLHLNRPANDEERIIIECFREMSDEMRAAMVKLFIENRNK